MQLAFVGNENKISVYSKIFYNSIKSSGESNINICGVFSTGIEETTSLAIELNSRAYLSLDDLIDDADVIFVLRNDSQLLPFCEYIKEKRIRGKIFCHFSTKYDSSVLSCGITNTSYAIGFPYTPIVPDNASEICMSFEGEGKRSEEFETFIKALFPRAVFCTKSDKRLAGIANRIVTEYLKILVGIAIKFFKFSGLYDENSFSSLATYSIKDTVSTHATRKVRKRSESEIKKDMRLLSQFNYSDTKELYKDMEAYIAGTGIYQSGERESILLTLKKGK